MRESETDGTRDQKDRNHVGRQEGREEVVGNYRLHVLKVGVLDHLGDVSRLRRKRHVGGRVEKEERGRHGRGDDRRKERVEDRAPEDLARLAAFAQLREGRDERDRDDGDADELEESDEDGREEVARPDGEVGSVEAVQYAERDRRGIEEQNAQRRVGAGGVGCGGHEGHLRICSRKKEKSLFPIDLLRNMDSILGNFSFLRQATGGKSCLRPPDFCFLREVETSARRFASHESFGIGVDRPASGTAKGREREARAFGKIHGERRRG